MFCVRRISTNLPSLPSWERGLKYHRSTDNGYVSKSLPSWERGLKYGIHDQDLFQQTVAPLVGARIEIIPNTDPLINGNPSLPSWERGLKSDAPELPIIYGVVAPLVGARIEI